VEFGLGGTNFGYDAFVLAEFCNNRSLYFGCVFHFFDNLAINYTFAESFSIKFNKIVVLFWAEFNPPFIINFTWTLAIIINFMDIKESTNKATILVYIYNCCATAIGDLSVSPN